MIPNLAHETNSLTMSVNRLPLETLYDIFHAYVRDAHGNGKSVNALVTISGVCQRWRNICLSHGVLWTYLNYYIGWRPRKWLIEVFSVWLDRSSGAPLNFTFVCNLEGNPSVEGNQAAERAVLMLLSHQWHWGKIDFYWQFQASPSFPGIKLTNMPMLTALRFHLKLKEGAKKAASINFAQSSKLEHLYLNGPFLLEVGDKPMRLVPSVDLDLGGFSSVQQYLAFLEVAPNLKKLQIVLKTHRPTNGENRSVISHNLQTLSLRDTAPVLLIDKLALPALKVLKYLGNEGGSLLAFFERSLPPLTRLEICGSCAGEETIMRILPLLPKLQALSLSLCTVSARLFELLSIRTGAETSNCTRDMPNQIVCPKLRWLFFRMYSVVGDVREFADALCNMLESRWDTLKLWDYVIGINVLRYPISTTDREKVYQRIQDREDFLAKCNGERYRRLYF